MATAKSPKAKAKAKAWGVFSKWVRLRDADKDGYVICCTCNKVGHWKEFHAGHYIDGRNNSVLFNERLVHAQCAGCNLFKAGNKVRYTQFMMLRYGYSINELVELDNLKYRTKKMGIADYKDIEEKYLDKIIGLEMKNEE